MQLSMPLRAAPPKVLRAHDQALPALWAAHLLKNYKGKDIRASVGASLDEIATRLTEACVAGVETPTIEVAIEKFGTHVLNPYMVLWGQWSQIHSSAGSVLRTEDADFPWRFVQDYCAGHLCFNVASREAIAKFALPWQERETLRLTGNGNVYAALPWPNLTPIPGHYAHIAIDDCKLVAYTQDGKKGERDIQTQVRPGRYLTQFYPDMDPDMIRSLAALVTAHSTDLKFAKTADEIERVYTKGPKSCLQPSARSWRDMGFEPHPVRIYGDSDLQVAYMTDAFGRIKARSVVWPEKKVYCTTYGDKDRIQAALQKAGYSQHGSWCFQDAKVRLIRHPHNNNALMCCIDGHGHSTPVDDQWLRIDQNGPCAGAGAANWMAVPELTVCGCGCGNRGYKHKSVRRTATGAAQRWAAECFHKAIAAKTIKECRFYNEWWAAALVEPVHLERDSYYGHRTFDAGPNYRSENCFYCAGSKHWFNSSNYRKVRMANGDIWERSYFDNHGKKDVLGRNIPRDTEASVNA